jgi:transcriptional regulator with XRE-family HTH domain
MAKKSTFTEAFSAELRRALRDQHLTVEAAAGMLGITRQAFHSYLNGSAMPHRARLARAIALFDLRLTIGHQSFDKTDFKLPEKKVSGTPIQLSFWEVWDSISENNLKPSIKRVGKTLHLSIRIEVPA